MDETQTAPQKNNTGMYIMLAVVILVVAGGGYMLLSNQAGNNTPPATQQTQTTEVATPTTEPTTTEATGSGTEATTKTFNVVGTPFAFDVKEMKVKKGDTVRVVFTNKQGSHDWVLDEFAAKTKVLKAGESETIEFVADQTGTFEYYCSVGSHRQMGMVGNLIVE